jgi:hypothetical protein
MPVEIAGKIGKPTTVRPNLDAVAAELGYVSGGPFGVAFAALVGERPGAWQRRHGVQAPRRRGGLHGTRGRKPRDRSGEIPLPRYPRPRADPDRSIGTTVAKGSAPAILVVR